MEEKPMTPPSAARFVLDDLYSNDPVKVRARAVELCAEVASEGYVRGRADRGGFSTEYESKEYAERIVPQVPRVKRRVYLKGCGVEVEHNNYSTLSANMMFDVFVDGKFDQTRTFGSLVKDYAATDQHETAAQLLDLIANPDEPAAPTPTPGVVLSALAVPETWSVQESAVMVAAYERTRPAHGVTETCFAVAAALLRHRQQLVAQGEYQRTINAPDPRDEQLLGARGRVALPVYGYAVRDHDGKHYNTFDIGNNDGSVALARERACETASRRKGSTVCTLYDGGPLTPSATEASR